MKVFEASRETVELLRVRSPIKSAFKGAHFALAYEDGLWVSGKRNFWLETTPVSALSWLGSAYLVAAFQDGSVSAFSVSSNNDLKLVKTSRLSSPAVEIRALREQQNNAMLVRCRSGQILRSEMPTLQFKTLYSTQRPIDTWLLIDQTQELVLSGHGFVTTLSLASPKRCYDVQLQDYNESAAAFSYSSASRLIYALTQKSRRILVLEPNGQGGYYFESWMDLSALESPINHFCVVSSTATGENSITGDVEDESVEDTCLGYSAETGMLTIMSRFGSERHAVRLAPPQLIGTGSWSVPNTAALRGQWECVKRNKHRRASCLHMRASKEGFDMYWSDGTYEQFEVEGAWAGRISSSHPNSDAALFGNRLSDLVKTVPSYLDSGKFWHLDSTGGVSINGRVLRFGSGVTGLRDVSIRGRRGFFCTDTQGHLSFFDFALGAVICHHDTRSHLTLLDVMVVSAEVKSIVSIDAFIVAKKDSELFIFSVSTDDVGFTIQPTQTIQDHADDILDGKFRARPVKDGSNTSKKEWLDIELVSVDKSGVILQYQLAKTETEISFFGRSTLHIGATVECCDFDSMVQVLALGLPSGIALIDLPSFKKERVYKLSKQFTGLENVRVDPSSAFLACVVKGGHVAVMEMCDGRVLEVVESVPNAFDAEWDGDELKVVTQWGVFKHPLTHQNIKNGLLLTQMDSNNATIELKQPTKKSVSLPNWARDALYMDAVDDEHEDKFQQPPPIQLKGCSPDATLQKVLHIFEDFFYNHSLTNAAAHENSEMANIAQNLSVYLTPKKDSTGRGDLSFSKQQRVTPLTKTPRIGTPRSATPRIKTGLHKNSPLLFHNHQKARVSSENTMFDTTPSTDAANQLLLRDITVSASAKKRQQEKVDRAVDEIRKQSQEPLNKMHQAKMDIRQFLDSLHTSHETPTEK